MRKVTVWSKVKEFTFKALAVILGFTILGIIFLGALAILKVIVKYLLGI